jgi:hypothetical protein
VGHDLRQQHDDAGNDRQQPWLLFAAIFEAVAAVPFGSLSFLLSIETLPWFVLVMPVNAGNISKRGFCFHFLVKEND